MSRRNHLLIQRLEVPNTLAIVIHFIPPPEPHQYPTTYVLDSPEIKCNQQDCDDKLDNEALDEYGAEYVKSNRRKLNTTEKTSVKT